MEGACGSTAAAEAGAVALELYLGLPSASPRPPAASAPLPFAQPKSGGTGAIVSGLDLARFSGSSPAGAHGGADERGSDRVKSEGPASSGADAPPPPPPLLDGVGLGVPSAPRSQDSEPDSKRVKIEQPTTGSAAAARRFTQLLDLVDFGMQSTPRYQDAEPEMERVPGSTAAAAIDLELHLRLPSASPRAPASADRVKYEGPTSGGADGLLLLLAVMDLGMTSAPRNQDSEPPSKLVKVEQQSTSSGAGAAPRPVKPLLAIQFPRATRRARRSRRRRVNPHPPVAAAHNNRALDAASDTVPAWVRAEVLPRHDLPGDLLLHYVGEKVLRPSDMNPHQARFLFPSGASRRFRAFLSADEIAACGFDCTDRKARRGENGKRAKATTYAGIPVSVYVSGGAGWGMSELKLNKFHRSDGTVINGRGYRQFIGRCGLVVGDGVEVWAFRRPAHRLCVLIARRDDVCPLDCNGRPHF
ncbi:hypothetical protein ACQ4PT_004664 [Festuca glaucescens]